jgi:exodeoxyribonuclease VII large subunit
MNNEKIFTVTEINNYIKYLIQNDALLSNLHVKGEISNFKHHTSGHMYFTLKDAGSRIRCVMFRGNAAKLKFMPEDGCAVILRGYFSIYERDGQYQFYSEDMIPEGTGSLYKAYEQLKKKLSAMGYFDEARKKKIPFMPRAVGVVTSPTGAAVRDIISIIRRRCPCIDVFRFRILHNYGCHCLKSMVQQCITGKNSETLSKNLVVCGFSPSEIIIIHSRQIVMYK